jgi:hypothetical protein
VTAPRPPERSEEIGQTSIGELIGDISSDLSELFRKEVELAKAELKVEAAKATWRSSCSASRPCSAWRT